LNPRTAFTPTKHCDELPLVRSAEMGTAPDGPLPVDGPLHGPPVELLRWPAEARRRDHLAQAGVARLLVLAPGAALPDELEIDEDWLREPLVESDVRARAARLRQVAAALRDDEPYVDDEHVLHRGHLTRRLSTTEIRLLDALIGQGVVPRERLRKHAWPDRPSIRDGAVDAAVSRLRKRLRGMGMQLRPARGRGYELVVGPTAT
jgi:hypothetical protein